MELDVLGCGGGVGTGERTTALRVNRRLLIDAGTGVEALPLAEMEAIEAIVLTHTHLDHTAYLAYLADSLHGRIQRTIPVYGRSETLQGLRDHLFNGILWPDFTRLPPERPVFSLEPLEPGESRTIAGLEVAAIGVNHVVPTQGYWVDDGEHAFAFSGDTTTHPALWADLNGRPRLDALLVEAAFANEDADLCRLAHHYCPQLLAADLAALEHDPPVYISHRKPGDEERILDECRAALPARTVHGLSSGTRLTL
jgi:ribonuclease BN (tRNA processing enzyme)